MSLFLQKKLMIKNFFYEMATSNSIFPAIVTIFNNYQCHCQFNIMNFNIDQQISIIKWYCPAKEGHFGRTAAVKCKIISVLVGIF
jgi:hypothetical protein